jgi:hypothetical protein
MLSSQILGLSARHFPRHVPTKVIYAVFIPQKPKYGLLQTLFPFLWKRNTRPLWCRGNALDLNSQQDRHYVQHKSENSDCSGTGSTRIFGLLGDWIDPKVRTARGLDRSESSNCSGTGSTRIFGLLGDWVDPDFRTARGLDRSECPDCSGTGSIRKSELLGDWVDPDFRDFRIPRQYF